VPAVPPAKVEAKPAASADPLGDLAKARTATAAPAAAATATAGAEPFNYFVQVGAFRTPEDAESQRARLSLSGIETRVSEREQSGRTVYRVRVGPFDKRDEAERTKEKLDASGLETALVRVQR
jgi:cell division protein FtsN